MALLTLHHNDRHLIKKARRIVKRNNASFRLTVRNGHVYTMHFNPGLQPRTESQQKNWSLFAKANAMVANDFADVDKKKAWILKLSRQTRYKTARGLARAYYINVLRRQMSSRNMNKRRANLAAARHLVPCQPTGTSPRQNIVPNKQNWTLYRDILWWQLQLTSLAEHIDLTDNVPKSSVSCV